MMSTFLEHNEQKENRTLLEEDLYRINMALYDHCMMMELTMDKKIVDMNANYLERFRYRKAELLQHDIRVLNCGYHSDYYYEEAWNQLEAGKNWSGELCMKANNEELVWLSAMFIPLQKGRKSVQNVLAIFNEITDRKQIEKWRYIALHNELTNLPNRRKFESTVSAMVKRAQHNNSTFALVFIDIDAFKKINDTLGHATGDRVLQEFANRLRSPLLGTCKVFHQSGDEFILIVENNEELNEQLTYMLQHLSEPITINDQAVHVTASAGVSVFPEDGTDINIVLSKADHAMYASKKHGGNRYHFSKTLHF